MYNAISFAIFVGSFLLKVRIYVLHMETHFKKSYAHGPICEIYV
jgi:hypothetical protein